MSRQQRLLKEIREVGKKARAERTGQAEPFTVTVTEYVQTLDEVETEDCQKRLDAALRSLRLSVEKCVSAGCTPEQIVATMQEVFDTPTE